ncbi:hypothetical protein E4U42_003400 [Claviceps africana]|uniref:Fatty acid desaturase domain-containing protein n=1 Tax=Claviceps africana TaxID=83212 RepID=A0A8K0J6X4_9HYPO|nr:hypothetical protein E4U42_003400 [Claviceps africana]
MDEHIVFDKALTRADHAVLESLTKDIRTHAAPPSNKISTILESDVDSGLGSDPEPSSGDETAHAAQHADDRRIAALRAARSPDSAKFEPTVIVSVDDCSAILHPLLNRYLLQPYVRQARKIARHDTDVVMITHLILYFTTSVPSALLLFCHFTYTHAILHVIMQGYYIGTYTLMQHQHIHQRGILAEKFRFFDQLYPYILDPLMGHTWNTYYFHHVKHHHVEGNGPDDLSSTLRFQRDSIPDFLHYVGRFYFMIWFDLPLYFLRKNRPGLALKTVVSELANYAFFYLVSRLAGNKATFFVYILPCLVLRIGLMVGNWAQHAFVDQDDPDSDFRSSVTLVDVASNRFCFNDGYHTSHHLNPLRHWREHPISFLEQKHTYAKEGALVFHNIDFLMISFRLLAKDYEHLAKCLVPIGDQINLTMEERVQLLKKSTRKFSEEEIARKFKKTR